MTEIVVWGLKEGETDRIDEHALACQCKTQADVDKVIQAASKDGWHSFRVANYDMSEPPSFTRAVDSKKVNTLLERIVIALHND